MHTKHEEEVFCLGCGKSLGKGYKVSKRKYCSNSCQNKATQEFLLQKWLATGYLPNWSGGETMNTPRAAYLRNYISEKQQNKCAICGHENTWQNQDLVFILDHIDGDGSNNKESNLRLICPNCNSQTATFAGRNKGKGRRPVRYVRNTDEQRNFPDR